jgi:hypothetical protein
MEWMLQKHVDRALLASVEDPWAQRALRPQWCFSVEDKRIFPDIRSVRVDL